MKNNAELISALNVISKQRGISVDILADAIESALVSAYKKNYNVNCNVRANLDRETGAIEIWASKTVVEQVENPFTEISIEKAKQINPLYEIGDVLEEEADTKNFGRIAAQTEKQVVQRGEKNGVYVELGKTDGIIPFNEVIVGENYAPNDHIKVYVLKIQRDTKGPQIIVSRTHPGLVKRLFELEVPEIQSGVVQIKSVAREAGQRTKIAVASFDPQVDAVGACVGQRGTRVENIVNELHNEKMDIIEWDPDIAVYIAKALGPAKVLMVYINEAEKAAKVIVPDNQLSLAIGKEGQNARLAAKLTGWKIDIKSHSQAEADMELEMGSVDGVPGSESGNDMFNDDEAFGEQGFNGAPMNFDDFGGQNI